MSLSYDYEVEAEIYCISLTGDAQVPTALQLSARANRAVRLSPTQEVVAREAARDALDDK